MVTSNALLRELTAEEIFKKYAFYAYDFTRLTGADGAAISNGNAGLEDISQNNRDATIIGTPLVEELTINTSVVKTLEDLSTNCVSTGFNGTGAFNRSAFRLLFVLYISDGRPSASTNLFGGIIPTNIGINIFIATTGLIGFQFGNSSGVYQWRSNVLLENGVNGLVFLEVQVDHVTDTVVMKINGESIAASLFSGTMTSIDPTLWSNTSNIYIGSLNNNGSALSNPATNSVLFAAAIPYFVNFAQDRAIDSYIYDHFFRWRNEIHITDESSANTLRTGLIADIFNGNGLPTVTGSVTGSHTGAMHICNSANITGWTSIDKRSYSMNDDDGFSWTNIAYLLHTDAASPNGNLAINIQGHISDSASAHEGFMSDLLADGYDVLFVALPIASNDNVETNPSVTAQSTAGHDQIKAALDDGTYNPLELYLFDKISAIDELAGNYTEIYCCGISGGGWCTTLLAAIDTRISKAVAVRGMIPRTFRDAMINTEGDYEQLGATFLSASLRTSTQLFNLGSTTSYIDFSIMATTGGRIFHVTTHRTDTCCFKGLTYDYWKNQAAIVASRWGGDFKLYTDTDVSRQTHAYSTFDMDEIFRTFDL